MKGIVIGIKEGRAVIMERGGSFREVKNRGYQLGQEIVLPQKRMPFPLAAAACLALFFFAGIGGYRFYNTPKSYLYVDINPSLRLEMNYFEKVISAVPLNEDAVVLLERCELDLSTGQGCVDSLVQGSLALGYLNESNRDVEINLHTTDKKLKGAMLAAGDRISENGVSVAVFELDDAQNSAAIANGISVSRMRALESYSEFFGGTLEESMLLLAETATPEIYAQIREYRRSTTGSDENAAANPQAGNAQAKQDKTRSPSGEPSAEYAARLQKAIESYTAYLGGSMEENTKLLEPLTIGEIYEKTKADRLARQAEKKSPNAEKAPQEKPAKPENENSAKQLDDRRLKAIESYAQYAGGSTEENAKLLESLTIEEIYEKIKAGRFDEKADKKSPNAEKAPQEKPPKPENENKNKNNGKADKAPRTS